MKKINFLIAGIVLAIAIVIGITSTGLLTLGEEREEYIDIGFIGPLTGEISIYGISSKEGVEMAIEQINREGGIDGKKVRGFYEDDICDKTNTINSLNKLIAIDNIEFVVGATCSGAVLAAAPIAEENKTILFTPVSTHPDITYSGDYIFRNIISDDFIGESIAKFIYDDLGKRNAAVIYVNQDYGVGLYNRFNSVFNEIGGNVTISEAYDLERTRDFRSIILKMNNTNPDVFVILSYASEGGLIVRQMKELGIDTAIIGGDTFGTEQVLESGGLHMEGTLSVVPFMDLEDLRLKDFIFKYEEKYNKEPSLLWASANAYDIVMLLRDGIEKYGYDPTKVREYLLSIKDYSGVGGNTTFNEYGDVIKPVKIQVVENGKFTEYLP